MKALPLFGPLLLLVACVPSAETGAGSGGPGGPIDFAELAEIESEARAEREEVAIAEIGTGPGGPIDFDELAQIEAEAAEERAAVAPRYMAIETRLLDSDLVNFIVEMTNADEPSDVEAYARCAAAQYAVIRGYGFARHVRTNVEERGGVWRGDAVYTISPAIPRGLQTIDAEVTLAECQARGIPTV